MKMRCVWETRKVRCANSNAKRFDKHFYKWFHRISPSTHIEFSIGLRLLHTLFPVRSYRWQGFGYSTRVRSIFQPSQSRAVFSSPLDDLSTITSQLMEKTKVYASAQVRFTRVFFIYDAIVMSSFFWTEMGGSAAGSIALFHTELAQSCRSGSGAPLRARNPICVRPCWDFFFIIPTNRNRYINNTHPYIKPI